MTSARGPEGLLIALGPGQPGTDEIYIKASMTAATELAGFPQAEDVLGKPVVMMSSPAELVTIAASIGGGFAGLAAAMNAWFGRHRHRSVRLVLGKSGESVEISGVDAEETAVDLSLWTFEEVEGVIAAPSAA